MLDFSLLSLVGHNISQQPFVFKVKVPGRLVLVIMRMGSRVLPVHHCTYIWKTDLRKHSFLWFSKDYSVHP